MNLLGAWFIQIPPQHPLPPPGIKSKNMCLLKFHFREILFYKYWTILKKLPPLTPTTYDLGPKSKICSQILFALLNAFQNDMTQPSSTKNHGGDIFQGKGLDAGQGLPHRDWAGVLPTQMFLNSNLITPENFIQLHPSVQKLFMIFFNTDAQTDRHTNSIQNDSPHYPIQVPAEIFFHPHKMEWAKP